MDWWLFESLTGEERKQFLDATRRRRYGRDEVVFHAGDAGDTLHLVQSGRLLVRVTTPAGENATLGLLTAGDAFGELALLRGERERTATVIAIEPTETLTLHRRDFEELRARNPAIDRVLVTLLADRTERLGRRLVEALYVPVQRRVVRRLMEVAEMYGGLRTGTVVTLTQEDLAGLAGATRPTVNQSLKRLESIGAISLSRGRIELRNVDALLRRAGE